MSRVYFHSPSGEAELSGSEREWLAHLASMPGSAAWDLDQMMPLDRAIEIVSMVPEVADGAHGANYLHTYMRQAQQQDDANRSALSSAGLRAITQYDLINRFIGSLRNRLRVQGVDLHVAGAVLASSNVELNTALAAGSDPIRLAAKIHGWCEVHCWVEGPDRAWLADLIDQGLDTGLYRRGLPYHDTSQGGELRWISQGWEQVQELLRARADEPVVLSYSVCEQFPHAGIADWLPAWPAGVPETWEGYESLSQEQKQQREERQEAWYDLDDEEKWQRGMAGLRRRRPWARLAPDTLASVTFGPAVTVFDLLAPDSVERVRAAVSAEQGVSA